MIEHIKSALGKLKLKNIRLDDYRILHNKDILLCISGGYNYDYAKNNREYLNQIIKILEAFPNSYIYKLESDPVDDIFYLDLLIYTL